MMTRVNEDDRSLCIKNERKQLGLEITFPKASKYKYLDPVGCCDLRVEWVTELSENRENCIEPQGASSCDPGQGCKATPCSQQGRHGHWAWGENTALLIGMVQKTRRPLDNTR